MLELNECYSDLESSFDTNAEISETDEDLEDLKENFKAMNLEPYQFEPTKEVENTNKESEINIDEKSFCSEELPRAGHVGWCMCKNCQVELREIDCLYCKEVDAIPDEKNSGYTFYSF